MERLGIAKLNGSNYSTWKTKVEFLLVRDDLWRYVIGTKPAAIATADAAGSSIATARRLLLQQKSKLGTPVTRRRVPRLGFSWRITN